MRRRGRVPVRNGRGRASPDGPQVCQEVVGAPVPGVRILAKRLAEHACQGRRDIGGKGGDRQGILFENGAHYGGRVASFEGADAGERLEEDHAEGPQVGGRVEWCAPDVLGTHVRHGPESNPFSGEVEPRHLRYAEIEQLHPVRGQQHVGRLHVAMHDPRAVGCTEPISDLDRDTHGLRCWQRTVRNALRQRIALVVREDEKELPVLALVNVVERRDVGVVERRNGSGFRLEPTLGVRAEVGRERFQRHAPAQAGVLGEVDQPHAAAPDLAQQAKRTDPGAF